MFARYASSKFRLILMGGMLVAVIFGLTHLAMAQSAGAGAAAAGAAAKPEEGKSGIEILMHTMDWVVIVALVSASIAGIALVIDCVLNVKEAKIMPAETIEHLRSLITARQFKELMDFTSGDTSFVSQSLNAGLRRAHLGYPAMREASESATGEQTATWFRRIELLNIIGNIGPLVGLLGTVLGMIIAFQALAKAGGAAKPAELSGGISTALWHTFGGLFVAIPCLLVFGFYRTKIDKITSKAGLLTEELLESLRPPENKAAAGAPAASGALPTSVDGRSGMLNAVRPAPRRVAPAAPAAPQAEESE